MDMLGGVDLDLDLAIAGGGDGTDARD